MSKVYYGNNLDILGQLTKQSIDLIYIDPPFNTGKEQAMNRIKTEQAIAGDRKGFKDQTYASTNISSYAYPDTFDSYVEWLMERIIPAYDILKPNGSMFVHLDYREVHYIKVAMDMLFGRYNMMNELIWSYDYGGRGKTVWPKKHDTILWYVKDMKDYTYNYGNIDRIPYMAPGLVTPEKVALGKVPTDVWWSTIVPTNGKERTGYPTQKPRTILDRIIKVHSNIGDTVLDFFAGSGTTGESAYLHNREFILVDSNQQAIDVMKLRFSTFDNVEWITK